MNGGPRVQKLDQQECARLLAETTFGRVSVTMGALPVIRSVRYALAADHVVFRAAPDSRLRAAAANSIIAFQADDGGDSAGIGWSVLVQGRCEEVVSLPLVEQLRSLPLPAWNCGHDAFLRLPLHHMTGELVYW